MIQAIGVADFHYKPTKTTNFKENVKKRIEKKKNKYGDHYEVLTVSDPYAIENDIYVRVSCSFTIYFEEKRQCRHIDDYVGHVFPVLKERLTSKTISTKVYQLTKVHHPVLK